MVPRPKSPDGYRKIMRIGPKYKIARRLGAPVFEKTQTQKFTLSQQRKDKGRKKFSRGLMSLTKAR